MQVSDLSNLWFINFFIIIVVLTALVGYISLYK
jgi:hypothetical protein